MLIGPNQIHTRGQVLKFNFHSCPHLLVLHLEPAWLHGRGIDADNLPDGCVSGWMHNESKASGKDCYRRVKNVWDAVKLEQARPRPPPLPPPGALLLAHPGLLLAPPASSGPTSAPPPPPPPAVNTMNR